MEILKELINKQTPSAEIVKIALDNKMLLNELIEAISKRNKDTPLRHGSFNTLMELCKIKPELIYNYWDTFVELIISKNAFHNYSGIYIISALIDYDTDNKFLEISHFYINLLYNSKVSVAMHVAYNIPQILKFYRELEPSFTKKMLDYTAIADTFKHGELVKSAIINAFEKYYPTSSQKEEIKNFVNSNKKSSSPKTRSVTKSFLNKYKI